MQRIAPNNQLPATHFVEVIKFSDGLMRNLCAEPIKNIKNSLIFTIKNHHNTIAIFHIRENKLPTNHKF